MLRSLFASVALLGAVRAFGVLPMRRFATSLEEFMPRVGRPITIDVRTERTLRISRESPPGTPTVIIPDGVCGRGALAEGRNNKTRKGSES